VTENPEDPHPGDDGVAPEPDEFAELDAREALFTAALAQAERVQNQGAAMLRQVMLAGFDAMVLEERQAGRTVDLDDIVVRAFTLHQATVLRIPRQAVMRQLTTGWTLRDSLPATWAVFCSGGCTDTAATTAADESAGLDGDRLVAFELAAAQLVREQRPPRLARRLAALRDRLDPEASIERHERASRRRHVTARPLTDGLRVPHRKAVQATLLVVVPAGTATGASNEPAELGGMGAIDAEAARHLLRHTSHWTRVVVDPVDDAVLAIDSKERYIPSGLKRLIHARSTSCEGDGCGLPAHSADLDHVVRVEHDGRTRHANLHPLCRSSHQLKDEGGHWEVEMDDDGTTVWRSRWGAVRVVRPALRVRTNGAPPTIEGCPF
jgi:hypothetical protein